MQQPQPSLLWHLLLLLLLLLRQPRLLPREASQASPHCRLQLVQREHKYHR
jgi:hypothetical protein